MPQVFGQVKEWLTLEFHKMIRVPHVAAWSVVFSLFYGLGRPAGVLRLIKNVHFLIFLAVWVLFLFGQVKELLTLELHEMIKVSHILACPIVFILLRYLDQHGRVLKHKGDGQF